MKTFEDEQNQKRPNKIYIENFSLRVLVVVVVVSETSRRGSSRRISRPSVYFT